VVAQWGLSHERRGGRRDRGEEVEGKGHPASHSSCLRSERDAEYQRRGLWLVSCTRHSKRKRIKLASTGEEAAAAVTAQIEIGVRGGCAVVKSQSSAID